MPKYYEVLGQHLQEVRPTLQSRGEGLSLARQWNDCVEAIATACVACNAEDFDADLFYNACGGLFRV